VFTETIFTNDKSEERKAWENNAESSREKAATTISVFLVLFVGGLCGGVRKLTYEKILLFST
jgi:hypothetical protein